ncbi:MAG: hypothetical protein WD646_01645 [Actinomycetota bacterium]
MGDGGLMGEGGTGVRPEAGDLERELAALPGVQAARVVATASGRVTEIHLITDNSKAPKGIVRDVETIAQARFGIELDRRIVSIVQFPSGAATVPAARRLALSSLSLTTEGSQLRCRVRLGADDETALGEAAGPATSVGRMKLIAQATASALSSLTKDTTLDVADVRIVDVGRMPVAVAAVIVFGPDGEELIFSGSVPVHGDENEAIVRAIIDAVAHPPGA